MKLNLSAFIALLGVLGTTGAMAQKNSRHLHGRVKEDTMSCDNDNVLVLPIVFPDGSDLPALCDFPVAIAGFFGDGLERPDSAAAALEGKDVGVKADAGYYRLSDAWDPMNPVEDPCTLVEGDGYIGKGKGGHLQDPPPAGEIGEFKFHGHFVLLRPSGQTSYVEEIPDQVYGMYEVQGGTVTFEKESETVKYTIVDYEGKRPVVDICAFLAP